LLNCCFKTNTSGMNVTTMDLCCDGVLLQFNNTPDNVTLAAETLDNVTAPVSGEVWKKAGRDFADVILVLDTYVTPILCGFGCLGNLVSLSVLLRARFRKYENAGKDSGTYVGLFLLAASDLIFCISMLPRSFISSNKIVFKSASFSLYYQVYGTGLTTMASLCSTWITVTMAVTRYLGICHPFTTRDWFSATRTKLMYGLVIVLAVGFNIPVFYFLKLVIHSKIYLTIPGPMNPQTKPGLIYYYIRAVFALLIPAVALVCCNFALVRALRRSQRLRRSSHVRQPRGQGRNRVTLTLVVIAISFIVLVLPAQLIDFFVWTIRNNPSKLPVFQLARAVVNILEVTTFSFNFLLYFSMNAQFRAVLTGLCPDTETQRQSAARQPLTLTEAVTLRSRKTSSHRAREASISSSKSRSSFMSFRPKWFSS
jgi:hypothetical protein